MFTLIIKETKKRHYSVMSRLFSVFLNVFLFLYFTTFQLYAIPFDSDFLLSDNQYKAFQNIRLPFDANQVIMMDIMLIEFLMKMVIKEVMFFLLYKWIQFIFA